MNHPRNTRTRDLVLWGIFAVLTAVGSWISIPLPFSPVPINLATLSVFLAGGLLGPKGGAVSQTVYVALGAFGLPVFHSFTGGVGILAGPTGGYLIGYITAALLAGLLPRWHQKGKATPLLQGVAILSLALFSCYTLGTLWFIFITGTSLLPALFLCVLPFLPGDIFKIFAALFLLRRLVPSIRQIQESV